SAMRRAQPANTKATRDRETSELARRLTEEATGSSRRPAAKKKSASTTAPSTPPVPINLPRNFLHAAAIEFQHPQSGKPVSLTSDLPAELTAFLHRLTHLQ